MGITVVIPLVVYFYALLSLFATRMAIQEDIDRLEPRVARMQGLLEAEGAMSQSVSAGTTTAGLVYPASQDQASVSAALQAEVRRLLSDAGMTITNSQVLPVQQADSFDRLSISVMATGDTAALDSALSSLALYRPILLVESLDVYPNRVRRGADNTQQILTARIQVMSLRSST